MPGIMSGGWDAYREEAGRQTENLNQMPFVANPMRSFDNVPQNQNLLYGKNVQSNALGDAAKAINDVFKEFGGREAKGEDYRAWLGAVANGTPITDVVGTLRQQLEAQNQPEAAPAIPSFSGGMMGGAPMGYTTSDGQSGGGLMAATGRRSLL